MHGTCSFLNIAIGWKSRITDLCPRWRWSNNSVVSIASSSSGTTRFVYKTAYFFANSFCTTRCCLLYGYHVRRRNDGLMGILRVKCSLPYWCLTTEDNDDSPSAASRRSASKKLNTDYLEACREVNQGNQSIYILICNQKCRKIEVKMWDYIHIL